jgi:hypothetical protein
MTRRSRRIGERKIQVSRLSALTCVTLLSTGALVFTAKAPAFATGPPSVDSAVRVYPVENVTMNFTGIDPISNEDRGISVANTNEGNNCDDSEGNDYSPDDCPQVQMSMSTTDAGLLNIPNLEIKHDSPDGLDHVVAPSGAVITNSSDGIDPSQLFYFNGTETQLNATLATLQFIPATDYRENRLAASDGTLPDLNVEVINGDGGLNDTVDTIIKVEGENQAPSVAVHQAPLDAVVDQRADFFDDANATDPEICTAAICGLPYTNSTPIADPDASMLLVAWLDANCGTFNFQGAEFTSNGSASNNSVDSLLLNALIDEKCGQRLQQRPTHRDRGLDRPSRPRAGLHAGNWRRVEGHHGLRRDQRPRRHRLRPVPHRVHPARRPWHLPPQHHHQRPRQRRHTHFLRRRLQP